MEDNKKDVVNGNQENQIENNNKSQKTYTQEEVNELRNQMSKEYQEQFDEKFNKRWGREMAKLDRNNAKANELIDLLKTQTGKSNIDELLDLSYEQYEVERPVSSKDEEILGRNDAKELLDSEDLEYIESELNRLASIKNRNPRQQATFMELGGYLTKKQKETKRKSEIQESGIDESILNDEGFKSFASKFRDDVSIKDIYETYSKVNGDSKKEPPFSAGSLRDTKQENKSELKDFYTPEEARKFTRKDFKKNPELLKRIEESTKYWGKK